MTVPTNVPSKKPVTVSITDVPTCKNRSPERQRFKKVDSIREGLLTIKASMTPSRAASSQLANSKNKIPRRSPMTAPFTRF